MKEYKEKIYITGAIRGLTPDQLADMVHSREALIEKGFKQVSTAVDMLPEAFGAPDAEKFFLDEREQRRSAADVVLWLKDSCDDIDAKQELARSRAEGKIVRAYKDFVEADDHRLERMLAA